MLPLRVLLVWWEGGGECERGEWVRYASDVVDGPGARRDSEAADRGRVEISWSSKSSRVMVGGSSVGKSV